MQPTEIITAITTVGFPIVMCAALFWYMIKQNQAHQDESNAMREAIGRLEIAITKLTDKLGGQ